MSLSIGSDLHTPRLSHHRAACERFRKHEMETRILNHMDGDEKPVLNPVPIAKAFQILILAVPIWNYPETLTQES